MLLLHFDTRAQLLSDDEGSCYVFRLKTIIANALHMMVLFCKVIINFTQRTRIYYGSVWQSLRIFLKNYPYKKQVGQELKSTDLIKHQNFSNWVLMQMEDDLERLLSVLQTDEAHCCNNNGCTLIKFAVCKLQSKTVCIQLLRQLTS